MLGAWVSRGPSAHRLPARYTGLQPRGFTWRSPVARSAAQQPSSPADWKGIRVMA